MKKFLNKHSMLIIGIAIFISIFARYFLLLNDIDIFNVGHNIKVDYKNLLVVILGVSLAITFFYYAPLLFLVTYEFKFNLRFKVHVHNKVTNPLNYDLNLSKQSLYRINNVIRC
ncbi:MAG: hypothetical protein ACLFRI_05585 [Candidatus Izemoplasmataceae bacterium]